MSHARLTAARRRKNREGLLDALGVPADGTLATPPGAPHQDVSGGVGLLEVGEEQIALDHDDLMELMEDVQPRPGRAAARRSAPSARTYLAALMEAARPEAQEEVMRFLLSFSPGALDSAWLAENAHLLFAPEVIEAVGAAEDYAHPGEVERPTGPGAVGGTRGRRRGAWAEFEATHGRADAGAKGDVDLPDAEVGESAAPRLSATLARAVDAGLITEEEAHAASGHASGDAPLSERREAPSGTRPGLAGARRLAEAAERHCGCGAGGDPDDRKPGCGGVCRMADRHLRRHDRAAGGGLRESEEDDGALRDWGGDLAA